MCDILCFLMTVNLPLTEDGSFDAGTETLFFHGVS
jgi:hypothetical protein